MRIFFGMDVTGNVSHTRRLDGADTIMQVFFGMDGTRSSHSRRLDGTIGRVGTSVSNSMRQSGMSIIMESFAAILGMNAELGNEGVEDLSAKSGLQSSPLRLVVQECLGLVVGGLSGDLQ